MSADTGQAPAPLVMRFGALGDMVLLTVLLRHLYDRFRRPVDLISSGGWTRPLLEDQPYVGRLFLIRSRRTPFLLSSDQWQLHAWLRRRAPGPVWYCDMKEGMGILLRAGIPADHIFDARRMPWQAGETFADRYIRMGNAAPPAFADRLPPPVPASTRSAQIGVTARARAETAAWLQARALTGRRIIVVHPGCRHLARRWLRSHAGFEKHWPEERWVEVLREVRARRPEHAILLSGTRAERALNEKIRADSGLPDVHNVADETPLRVLEGVLERAHSMISIDTGPAHVAAALGCPTVALFAFADTALFRPGGATTPAVCLTGTIEGQRNILGITPQQVIAAWEDLIGTLENSSAHSVK